MFGEVPGFPPGSTFSNQTEVSQAGVHRPPQGGICGTAADGAESIVVSGGYEDDQDFGDEIVYTGHGGRDPETGKQVANQELIRGNAALATSQTLGIPVRVVRGVGASEHGPNSGYRYDGLFRVVDSWHEIGRSGFRIWRFRLLESEPADPVSPAEPGQPPRSATTILRVVRDTALSKRVKDIHDYTCQVCGVRLEGPSSPYAEGAHIRPLGTPHNGPDVLENLLCLCPNHHFLFDVGSITINDDYTLNGVGGRLRIAGEHQPALQYLRYHREHYSRES